LIGKRSKGGIEYLLPFDEGEKDGLLESSRCRGGRKKGEGKIYSGENRRQGASPFGD